MSFATMSLRLTQPAMPLLAAAGPSITNILEQEPSTVIKGADQWVFAPQSPARLLYSTTERQAFYGANLKARLSPADSRNVAMRLQSGLGQYASLPPVEVVLFPSALALMGVKEVLVPVSAENANFLVGLGAQNFGVHGIGNYTGEEPLAFMPVSTALVGHMERVTGKAGVPEDDLMVRKKLRHGLEVGRSIVLCVGEQEPSSSQDKLSEVEDQLHKRLGNTPVESLLSKLIVAYEPGSAIGGGEPADPLEVEAIHGFIRFYLSHLYGASLAAATPIIYGGSVTAKNVRDYTRSPQIDGALVGTASTQILEDQQAHMTRLVLQGLGVFE